MTIRADNFEGNVNYAVISHDVFSAFWRPENAISAHRYNCL